MKAKSPHISKICATQTQQNIKWITELTHPWAEKTNTPSAYATSDLKPFILVSSRKVRHL